MTYPTEPAAEVVKYADEAMFQAEPLAEGEPVEPRVSIISMTPNPLRVMAAAAELYQGRIVRYPEDVSRETAMKWLDGFKASKISAPLEWIHIAFLIENVTRAFTHQLVRQRTAVYVQESMRFAVKDNAAFEVALPPSLQGLEVDDPRILLWNGAVRRGAGTYNALINAGIPAEDARGLLPTNITTRIHYDTNLRNLVDHSGMRLCSQAQAEWKAVWREMIRAMIVYGAKEHRWQQREIVRLFKPVCYQTGKCEFMGPADRYCSIRSRVEAHHIAGDKPDTWTDINPQEPLHPEAARRM